MHKLTNSLPSLLKLPALRLQVGLGAWCAGATVLPVNLYQYSLNIAVENNVGWSLPAISIAHTVVPHYHNAKKLRLKTQ